MAANVLCSEESTTFLGIREYEGQDVSLLLATLRKTIKERLEKDDEVGRFVAFATRVASSLLNEFCALNWTGPGRSEPACVRFHWDVSSSQWGKLSKQSLDQLSLDGEMFYPLSKEPMLLLMSKTILLALRNHRARFMDCALWCLRSLFVYQQLLHERILSLWETIDAIMSRELEVAVSDEDVSFSRERKTETLVEMGRVCLFYLQYSRAKGYFTRAQKMASLDINLTGALGKRTRFQAKDTAQLVLSVVSTSRGEEPAVTHTTQDKILDLPKDVLLNDDTILENIKFSSQEPGVGIPSSPLEQAVVLGQCVLLKKTSPKDRLRTEELEAYITSVLAKPLDYCIQSTALFLRSVLQDRRRVTVERAMLQLQELVGQYSNRKGSDLEKTMFYCVDMPPHWVVERELAATLVSLGSTASALEVFERLQLWEDVITCYHSIGRSGKAESIIREQLLQKETPTMWCLLGDVTKDGQYYQKAWEVSGQRSSRAQRSLGMLHLRGKKFAECVQCLRKSTNINFLQEGVWFSMGYAANEIGDYDTALESFHNCVTLEPDHGEAWNNLAAIYIKKKNKSKAHLMLQESLKQNFENWKVWENYLLVSTDTGAFKDAITAFHRLIDLKEKYYDVEVLGHLVAAIVGNMVDNSGQKVSHLRKDLGELCGRIVSKVSTDPLVWKLYSDFHLSSDSEEDREKGVLELQKAQRLTRQREGWETDETQLMKVFQLTVQYSRVCRQMCVKEGVLEKRQHLSSAKLACNSVLSKMRNFETVTGSIPISVSEGILELESELAAVIELLQSP